MKRGCLYSLGCLVVLVCLPAILEVLFLAGLFLAALATYILERI